ncbi:MAG: hypothetical protein GY696_39345 [Gammaproteobacteria bacterium]|nr:hypothetical protein [Gammaproteobacteria bacterium]
MEHPKNEEQQLKEEAFRDGLKILERTYGRYKAADTEVLIQLMLEVEKELGGEDEAAFTKVIEEDEVSNDTGEFHQEAMTTIRRMKVLLVVRRMCLEGFQDLEKIGIEDPPVAVDDDDRERNHGKIQRNQDEQVNFDIVERMDSTKDSGKQNSRRETKFQMDFNEWLRVMAMIFMMVMRIWKDKLKHRMVWNLGWTGSESNFPESELEDPLDSLTETAGCKEPPETLMAPTGQATVDTEMLDGCRMMRRPFERVVEEQKKWWTSHFCPPGVLQDVSDDRTSGEEASLCD